MRRICSCTALSMFRLQYLINPTDEARGRDGLDLRGEDTFHIPGILFEVSATNSFHFISGGGGYYISQESSLNSAHPCQIAPRTHVHQKNEVERNVRIPPSSFLPQP